MRKITMKKEEIYINLRGKSKESMSDLWDFLKGVGEVQYGNKVDFLTSYAKWQSYEYLNNKWVLTSRVLVKNKQEVTIQQLKEILQPMETKFTPIAMKCTQEQFEAVKLKLKGFDFTDKTYFDESLLTNNVQGNINCIGFVVSYSDLMKERTVHEEWNEEIFLKACGIEVETLEQQLEKAKAEVKRLEDEISKIKVGDLVCYTSIHNKKVMLFGYCEDIKDNNIYIGGLNYESKQCEKITDQELINKLNNLIK